MSEIDTENVFSELRTNQRTALEELLSGAGKDAAADAAGVTVRTVNRWHKEPLFRAALEEATGGAIGDVARRMVGAMDTAVGVIMALANDAEAPASVRLRAAIALIEHGPKLFDQHNYVERLQALEERIREIEQ